MPAWFGTGSQCITTDLLLKVERLSKRVELSYIHHCSYIRPFRRDLFGPLVSSMGLFVILRRLDASRLFLVQMPQLSRFVEYATSALFTIPHFIRSSRAVSRLLRQWTKQSIESGHLPYPGTEMITSRDPAEDYFGCSPDRR